MFIKQNTGQQFQVNIMTSRIRHKHKLKHVLEPQPKIFYQNQFLTQMPIRAARHTEKKIYQDSDEQDEIRHTQQVTPPQEYDLKLPTRRPLSRQCKPSSYAMRPSIMQNSNQCDQSYDDIINCPKTSRLTHKSQHHNTAPKSNNFIQELINQKNNGKRQEKISLRPFHKLTFSFDQQDSNDINAKQKLEEKILKPEDKEKQRSEKIVIPKIQISNLYFEVSDEEDNIQKQSQTKVQIAVKEQQQAKYQKRENKENQPQFVRDVAANNEGLNPQKMQAETVEEVDITDCKPNSGLIQKSLYLYRLLQQNAQMKFKEMLTPLLPSTKQVFEVHVYSSLSEKEYMFWLDMGKQMILLMKARKFININRTQFQITTYDDQKRQWRQNCSLISNFDRSKFNIYKQQRKTSKKRILGTICTSITLTNSKSILMYYPKLNQQHQPTIFYSNSSDIDLQLYYRQNQLPSIDFIMTTKLELVKMLQIMNFYELRTSQKSMEFKNNEGQMKVIIGKKGSKRYKIVGGSGLSPVQIFALTIVQIQT